MFFWFPAAYYTKNCKESYGRGQVIDVKWSITWHWLTMSLHQHANEHHTIIEVFIGFVCVLTTVPLLGPMEPNSARRQGTGRARDCMLIIILWDNKQIVCVRVRVGILLARRWSCKCVKLKFPSQFYSMKQTNGCYSEVFKNSTRRNSHDTCCCTCAGKNSSIRLDGSYIHLQLFSW